MTLNPSQFAPGAPRSAFDNPNSTASIMKRQRTPKVTGPLAAETGNYAKTITKEVVHPLAIGMHAKASEALGHLQTFIDKNPDVKGDEVGNKHRSELRNVAASNIRHLSDGDNSILERLRWHAHPDEFTDTVHRYGKNTQWRFEQARKEGVTLHGSPDSLMDTAHAVSDMASNYKG